MPSATSNLSMASINILTDAITRLKQLGKTIVIAEHRLFFLRDIDDLVLYLRNGTITRRFDAAEFFAMSDSERRALGLRSLHRQPVPALPSPAAPTAPEAAGSASSVRSTHSEV